MIKSFAPVSPTTCVYNLSPFSSSYIIITDVDLQGPARDVQILEICWVKTLLATRMHSGRMRAASFSDLEGSAYRDPLARDPYLDRDLHSGQRPPRQRHPSGRNMEPGSQTGSGISPMDRMTQTCENITLFQTSLREVIITIVYLPKSPMFSIKLLSQMM